LSCPSRRTPALTRAARSCPSCPRRSTAGPTWTAGRRASW
jgi:hypothetical protein